MADIEEKFKKLQQYVRSILPRLEKVDFLEEENHQLKASQSQELEHKRSVLETEHENLEKEKEIFNADKENLEKERNILKADKDKMRKMKEKFEITMKASKSQWEEQKSQEEKWIEEEKKLLKEERILLMEEKNIVQDSTKKMLEERKLIEEDKNEVMLKLKSHDEKEKKFAKDMKSLSKAMEKLKEERDQNRRTYEDKARKFEEERKDLDREIEILEKERLYIDEDWQIINDWKNIHHSNLSSDLETKEIEQRQINKQTVDDSTLALEFHPSESDAPKRKRGRPRKDGGGVTKKIKIKAEKVDPYNEITLDPDFFADSPEAESEPSTLDLHYQELLKIEEESESSHTHLSARQLLEEVSLLL